jgi:thioredoxin-dependent peroxiredoxin
MMVEIKCDKSKAKSFHDSSKKTIFFLNEDHFIVSLPNCLIVEFSYILQHIINTSNHEFTRNLTGIRKPVTYEQYFYTSRRIQSYLAPQIPSFKLCYHILPLSPFNPKRITSMPTHLKEGDKAPLFKAKDQNGATISLSDLKGKKVVIYFYPEDDTPVCTVQACNLRDNYGLLKKEGFVVLGVSPDGAESHKKFEEKFGLPFSLLADEKKEIMHKYGVWGEKNLYGHKHMGVHRHTFLIDEKGVIRKIFLRPKTKTHAEEIVKHWNSLK